VGGRFVFTRPDGSVISDPRGMEPADGSPLEAKNAGLEIDDETCTGGWDGSRMDLGACVENLLLAEGAFS